MARRRIDIEDLVVWALAEERAVRRGPPIRSSWSAIARVGQLGTLVSSSPAASVDVMAPDATRTLQALARLDERARGSVRYHGRAGTRPTLPAPVRALPVLDDRDRPVVACDYEMVRVRGRPVQRRVEVSCPVRYEPSAEVNAARAFEAEAWAWALGELAACLGPVLAAHEVTGPALQGWKNAPDRDAAERGFRHSGRA